MTIANIIPRLGQTLIQHSPAILTGIGVAGVVGTAVLAGRATVRAFVDIVDEEVERDEELTFKEKVQLTWHHFLPPLFVGSVTIASVISAQSINMRRNALLASLYTMLERSSTEFEGKSREVLGDKKVDQIKDEIATERVQNHKPDEFFTRQIEVRGDGVGLCMDIYSNRYFVSSRNEVDAAVNETNAEMNREGDVSLNFFYDQIGLQRIPVGEEVGWNQQSGLLTVQYTYVPSEDGSPCMAVTFKRQPEHEFHRIWR